MGRGLLPDTHPLCVNGVRNQALHRADLILLAGAWFDWRFRLGTSLNRSATVIHVHPDPDELGRNVDSAMCVREVPMPFLGALAASMREKRNPDRSSWLAELVSFQKDIPNSTFGSAVSDQGLLDPHWLIKKLRESLPSRTFLVVEASLSLSVAQHGLVAEEPFSWLDPGRGGCIGAGIPLAMGACCAHPHRPVLAIVGDAGFGMSGFDLETAVRHHLPVKVIVMNNSGISGHLRQKAFLPADYPERFSAYQDRLAYEVVAGALGCAGESVSHPGEWAAALDRLFQAKGPYCLNAHVNPLMPPPRIW